MGGWKMRIVTVVACAALLAGCNTSYNYFQDDVAEDQTPTNAFGMVLEATGVVPKKRAPIEYEPRAPLAMPPGRDLPPPEDRTAARDAVDWPDDPDEAAERRRRASLEAGAEQRAYENSPRDSDVARASPETIQNSRMEGGGLRRETTVLDEIARIGEKMSPRELARTFRGQDDSTRMLTETGEPTPRRYLIEPPAAYRTPSEGAPLPEAKDVEHSEWGKDQLYQRIGERKPPRAQN